MDKDNTTNNPTEGEQPAVSNEQSSIDIENLKTEMDTLKSQNTELGGRNEELLGRIESLQESLDSALEEMSLKGGVPTAEPESQERKAPTSFENKVEKSNPEKEVNIEQEIERSVREDQAFRTQQEMRVEHLELRQEVRDLDDELRRAISQNPNASEQEILLELEDMTDQEAEGANILELAKLSHERRTSEIEEFKTKFGEEFKTQLSQEGEGGISVPQSSGSPPAPSTPITPGASSVPTSTDGEWGDALKRAKVEGGGV